MPVRTEDGVARHEAKTDSLEIALDDVFCPCCQHELASAIKQLPHVADARVDLKQKVAHVTVRAGMTDAATLRRQIEACNFRNPVPLPKAEVSSHEAMHHAATNTAAHGGHEAMGHDMSDPRMAASTSLADPPNWHARHRAHRCDRRDASRLGAAVVLAHVGVEQLGQRSG